ncbi:hypothetical protein C4580_05515 [Candidatus Woesearchaeota archaeon]|nr:MAG: hypothetical protein C4580_05515 [Candidatus Woesearchaeota archaeon]
MDLSAFPQHLPQQYHDCLALLKPILIGQVDLIGGTVYGTLAKTIHGTSCTHKDFDFLVDGIKEPLAFSGFKTGMSRLGNPRLTGPDIMIDLLLITNVHSIHRRGLAPSRENYLSGVPLTVQSIAYDTVEGRLIGEVGISSVLEKTVGANNPEEAEFEAQRKGFGRVEEYIDSIAEKLGFTPIYPRKT